MTFRISGLLCMSRQFSVGASSDIRPPGREGGVRRCEMTCVQSTKLKSIIFSPDIDVSNKRAVEAFLPVFPQIFPSADRFSDEKAWFLQELLEWYVFSDCGDGTDLRLAGLNRGYVDVSLGL